MAMTNPILDELSSLSPGAQAALVAAHGAAATPAAAPAEPNPPAATMTAPQAPQPSLVPALPSAGVDHGTGRIAPMMAQAGQQQRALAAEPAPTAAMTAPGMSSPMPSLPSAPMPDVRPEQRGTLQGDKLHLQGLLDSGSGISQIAGKVEGTDFGQNHPLLGKVLGGAAQGLATLGDVGLSAVAPEVAVNLPGTEYRHDRLVKQDTHQLAQDESNAEKEAQTAQEQAQTGKTTAETERLPQEEDDKHRLTAATIGNLDSETTARDNPKPKFSVHDTEDGPLFVNEQTGEAQHLSVDGSPVGPKLKLTQSQPIMGADGKPHTYMLDDKGAKVADLGVHYERPTTVNVNAGEAALDREAKQFGAPHQKSLDASNAQLEKIADARAMINGNAESQGLGIPKVLTALVGGQGTGVRITQAELTSIAHARGLSGDVEGTLNKWAGKGALSKQQQQQLTQIMDDVKTRLLQKQAITSSTLDSINGASAREQIIAADKAARKQLSDLETGNAEPNRPANVPDGYKFNAIGPKGPGWYAPTGGK